MKAAEVVGICFWHFSPVPTASSNIGYWGHTGKHLLIARFSHFDPQSGHPHRLRRRLANLTYVNALA